MDKFIDKLIDSSWFMKIVALLLALLLFSSIYDGSKDLSDNYVPGDQDSTTIHNVPVKGYYDTENLAVSGIPKTVDVHISGPKSLLQQVKIQQNFEVYVDLTKAEIGNQKVKLRTRNITDKLEVTIKPDTVRVDVQEKVTKEFKVEPEFNSRAIQDGYIYETPVVNPGMVKITGAKNVIDQISYVKATLNIRNATNRTVSQNAAVTVLDKDLNKLDVIVQPNSVLVTIPIKSSSKTVPIRIVEKGTPKAGVSIDSIKLNVDDAKITGKKEVLDKTQNVRVEVDISNIDADTELTLPVIISDGITSVDPETVKATVNVTQQTDTQASTSPNAGTSNPVTQVNKSISNIPIQIQGLNDNYVATFRDPVNGKLNLDITGDESVVKNLTASDFALIVNLTGLEAGQHETKIVVNGPANIKWTLPKETVSISISQKEA
ncbi:YbbR-like domain-containing protein [Bacillus sp. 03113]|uniref:CdaR family protein n=1 Tax=Bacillus sp. 03113 TaxID=2578211 RepID=UPI001143C827|nr:CdaR family protein [Bacillus sp. 03113]